MNTSLLVRCGVLAMCLGLSACSSAPPVPDWQLNARQSVEKATQADLLGLSRVADVEWRRAVEETRRTADPARMARVGLVQCAVQQASLALDGCALWRALEGEAALVDQAYGRYLAGVPRPDDIAVLPAAHQPMARLMLTDSPPSVPAALTQMPDPLSRLVAASALLRAGMLDLDGVSVAVETAAEMGWRRPLAAWLALQVQQAQAKGQDDLSQRAQRRLDLLTATATAPPAPRAD